MTPTKAPAKQRGFSTVRRAHSLVLVSVEVAHTAAGKAVGDVAGQTNLVLTHISTALGDEGFGLCDVVQVSVNLTRHDDFAAFDFTSQQHFDAPYTAHTKVLATPPYPNACVEVTVVAAEPPIS